MSSSEPFVHEPGDMGRFEQVQVGVDASGAPVLARRQVAPATYTGGFDASGRPTRAAPWTPPR